LTCSLLLLATLGVSPLFTREQGFCENTPPRDKPIVAEVNGKAITARELEKPLAQEIQELERQISELKTATLDEPGRQQQKYELEQQIFELKQKKLDELIGQQLLDEEAARRGMSVAELLAKEAYPLPLTSPTSRWTSSTSSTSTGWSTGRKPS